MNAATMLAATVLVLTAALVPAGDGPDRVRDPYWTPRPGDRVEVHGSSVPAASSPEHFREMAKFLAAGDQAGLRAMAPAKLAFLDGATPVLVIKDHKPQEGGRIYDSPAALTRSLQEAALAPRPDEEPIEVRVLDGPHKDQLRFLSRDDLARMVDRPKPMPKFRPKSPPPVVDQKARAAMLLRSAENLEKAGKPKGAADFYRMIVKDYPESAEAKKAAARLGVLAPAPAAAPKAAAKKG